MVVRAQHTRVYIFTTRSNTSRLEEQPFKLLVGHFAVVIPVSRVCEHHSGRLQPLGDVFGPGGAGGGLGGRAWAEQELDEESCQAEMKDLQNWFAAAHENAIKRAIYHVTK